MFAVTPGVLVQTSPPSAPVPLGDDMFSLPHGHLWLCSLQSRMEGPEWDDELLYLHATFTVLDKHIDRGVGGARRHPLPAHTFMSRNILCEWC